MQKAESQELSKNDFINFATGSRLAASPQPTPLALIESLQIDNGNYSLQFLTGFLKGQFFV